MSPFDREAAAHAEAVFQRHLAAVSARTEPLRRRVVDGPPPPPGPEKKRLAKRGTPFPALDYAAWCADLAGFLSQSRSLAEIAERFGVGEETVRKRLARARKEGITWPPDGMRQQWVRAGGETRLVVRAK